jgi:hypothetical protein
MILYGFELSFTSKYLIVEFIPTHIFYKSSTASSFITFSRAESEMFLICLRRSNKSCITWSITTVFTVICEFIRIETLPYRRMCSVVTNLCRNPSIKSIEISEPVSVIVLVDILYNSSLYRIKLCIAELISEDSSLFTTNATSTIPDNFFSFCLFSILFEKFWNFTKIHCSSRYRMFKMSETIFVIISHIENEIFIFFI